MASVAVELGPLAKVRANFVLAKQLSQALSNQYSYILQHIKSII